MDFKIRRGRLRRTRRVIPRFTPCGYCFEAWARCWDHIIPYSYLDGGTNPDNLFPSCRACNAIASDKVFNTLEGKRDYILAHRQQRKVDRINGEQPAPTIVRQVRARIPASDALVSYKPTPRTSRPPAIDRILDSVSVFELERLMKRQLNRATQFSLQDCMPRPVTRLTGHEQLKLVF